MSDTSPTGPDPLDDVLDRLLDLPPEDRIQLLDQELPAGSEGRGRIEALLKASEAGGAALERAGQAVRQILADPKPDDAPELPSTLPSTIGGFEILRRLGSGGMGTVYLARRMGEGLDREVALKVVGRTGEEPARERFRAEQRILSRLEHPNVARLYEAGIDEHGAPFFVMEYVDGLAIDDYADQRALTLDERVRLVRQLADALAYAHRNLIVHRDVKPSNILVTPEGVVKLLDFGVAKLLESEPDADHPPLTRPGAPLLTPEYASPEQIRGEPVTTAADVYATGVLLYELLTGVRPYEFASRSPVHIEAVISGTEPRRPSAAVTGAGARAAEARRSVPSKLARSLSGDLDWVLLKALRKEPEARYGSIQELAEDLDRYLRGQPVQARKPTLWYRTRRFVGRNRGPVAAVGLIIGTLTLGLAGTWWQADRATRQAEQASRVKELVVGLFEGAAPDHAQGRDITALELLDQGQRTLLSGLEDEPEVRTELLNILGGVYTSLGEYGRAEPLLDSALAVAEGLGDETLLLSALAAMADFRYATGDYDEGEALAQRRLAVQRRIDPSPSTALAAAMTDVATFLSSTARFDEAEALLLEALEMDRALGAAEKEGQDWNSLSILRARRSDYDGAIEAGRAAV
ncbi:MAG: serine/threonine protein kinase, partial [Gemmatimonadota bacterium]|nr:serine/threonine protein kinase [Gemmatimonadota bacterium]